MRKVIIGIVKDTTTGETKELKIPKTYTQQTFELRCKLMFPHYKIISFK